MEITRGAVMQLEADFRRSRKILTAIGDETRLHLLGIMLGGSCRGERAVDIAKKTNLSRPAVSHHLQILLDAGIVKARKEGTRIFYYLEPDANEIGKLESLFGKIRKIVQNALDRSE